MNPLPSVAIALLLLTGCTSSPPVSPSENASLAVTSLSPSSGPVGTRVTVRGSGFTATGNTLVFAAVTLDDPREMPNEPSVIPDMSSDGSSVSFEVQSVWRPACSYAARTPCPFARIATTPGTYRVSIMNSAGTSNGILFVVTR